MAQGEWAALAAKGEAPGEACLRKTYEAEEIRQVDEPADRRIQFTISTESVDRDRDVIQVDGWDLRAFKRAGVVLWAHDYHGLPVARPVKVWAEEGKLKSVAEFAPPEMYPFADTVYQMLRGGFLKSASVGFRPKKWNYNEDRRGTDFVEQELLEFSVVPVPANPEALIDAKAAGIDVEPLREWARGLLLGEDDEQKQFEIQSVLFPKARWDSADVCRAWLREHDFKTGGLDETEDHYRFRQRDPDDFLRMRTICLAPGRDTPLADCRVKAIGGPLKIFSLSDLKAVMAVDSERFITAFKAEMLGLMGLARPAESLDEFDLAAILSDTDETFEADDVIAALREVVVEEAAAGAGRVVRLALGRVD